MKKKSLWFAAACLVICLIPSVGMLFFPTTKSTENKEMAAAPRFLNSEGTFNKEFFHDFEDYFNEHIALRNQLVTADAGIQSALFHESNVSGVIRGKNGWLYYASTLDDYLGRSVLSDRETHNLAHNFAIIQEYLSARNIAFTLTIPPNKNTLYGENMPYYDSYAVNSEHSAKLLAPLLSQQGIHYLNLFDLFENQNEVLYQQRDSHWNMKGACMAYNGIMNALGLKHEDYSAVKPVQTETRDGDLNRMLYSFYGKPEKTYEYDIAQKYTVANEADSVEDGWIITENAGGSGTLLMFRDSFANTLIPFLSNEFQKAYFSKGEPNALEQYVEAYSPGCVVIEKVERNITDYLNAPPIISAPEIEAPKKYTISFPTDTTITVAPCKNDVNYYKISGSIVSDRFQDTTDVLAVVNGHAYRAYQTGDNGYELYLKTSAFTDPSAKVRIFIVNGDDYVRVAAKEFQLPTAGK